MTFFYATLDCRCMEFVPATYFQAYHIAKKNKPLWPLKGVPKTTVISR